MKIGIQLPHIGAHASPEHLREFARRAEAAGFYSVWAADHVAVPERTHSSYSLDDAGRIPPDGSLAAVMGENFECLTTLAHVAAVTSTLRLGTSVAVVPLRQPLLNAKMLASIDALSGGRLIYGAGVGWLREEADAIGMPWDERGARTDEHLQILRAVWSAEHDYVRHNGRFYSFEAVDPRPRPAQDGGPPILIGGHSDAALSRVGRLGDGWIASRMPPERLAERFELARQVAAEHNRNPAALQLFTNADFSPSETLRGYAIVADRDEVATGMTAPTSAMVGADEMIATLRRYSGARVDHVKVSARMPSAAAELEWLEMVGRAVLPVVSD